LGNNDFDTIENFRDNNFLKPALVLRHVPSSPKLRQRFDSFAAQWFELVYQIDHNLLSQCAAGMPIDFGTLACGYTPVELDTIALNNSFNKKELVGRTYAGVDGYCPFAVCLGSLGCCLELALRPGVQYYAAERVYNFVRFLPVTASLVAGSLLVRDDFGFCSHKLMQELTRQAAELIRTFIHEMNKAARLICHAGRWILGLGESDSSFAVFERHYGQLKTA